MRSKKKLIIIIAAVVVVIAAVLVFLLTRKSGNADNMVMVQSVKDVNSASSSPASRYSGIVETQQKQKADFDTSKTLGEILVEVGDTVKVGDKLFTYDTQSITLDISQKELDIELLNQSITDNKAEIERLTASMNKASTADQLAYSAQIQQLKAQVAQSEYDIKTKTAELEKLKLSIDKAFVAAEISGTIESIGDVEAIIQGMNYDDMGNPDNTLVTILGDGDLRIKGTISEQNIFNITEGMPVIVRSRVSDDFWNGTISLIETSPESNNNNFYYDGNEQSSSYPFYITLDSISGLMLGQHVIIEPDFGQGSTKTGIWLDAGWLVMEEDETYVWASKTDNGRIEKRKVTLGEFDENMYVYEITDGLSENDFIAWPSDTITAGSKVCSEAEAEGFVEDNGFEEGGYVEFEEDAGMYEEAPADTDYIKTEVSDGPVTEFAVPAK